MAAEVLRVDDRVASRWGPARISRLVVCLQPTIDPAGEVYGIEVEALEPAHCLCIADLDNGHWIYGSEAVKHPGPGNN